MSVATKPARVGDWVIAHITELAIFVAAVVLRVSLHFGFDAMAGFDANQHWEVARWIFDHGQLPTAADVYCGYHPPLYYAAVAGLLGLGASASGAQWLSIGLGISKLALIWLGLEWYVERRAARIAGLSLAAVMPVAVHMDGMLTNEVASGFFAVAAMVLVPKAFRAEGRKRWLFAGAIGVLLALQLLSKISALMCIAAIGFAVLLELGFATGTSWRSRVMRALPWSLVLVMPLLLTGWYFERNVRAHGKPFLSSFDVRPEQLTELAKLKDTSYFDRRSLGFLVGWEAELFDRPYYDVATGPRARFVALVVASTFVDYYNYYFSSIPGDVPATTRINNRPMTLEVMAASQRSMIGGTVIALATAIAFAWCLIAAVRRRDAGLIALLVLPLLALASGLHFAIKYPFDYQGVIKSSYLQFAMMSLYGTFGLAVAWSLDRRRTWPVFVVLTVSVWLVFAYTVYCRLRLPLLPL